MLLEIVLVAIATLCIWKLTKKPSNYPPGFWGLPFLGYIPLDGKTIFQRIMDARNTMGDIIYWRMGTNDVVFLLDYSTIKKYFSMDIFSSRPNFGVLNLLQPYENSGIIGSWGSTWSHNRRFALKNMRDLGMGKTKTVDDTLKEANEFVKSLRKQSGIPASIPKTLKINVFNVSWNIVASERFDYDDPILTEINQTFTRFLHSIGRLLIVDTMPWIKWITPTFILNQIIYKETNQAQKLTNKFWKRTLDIHKESLDENNPRDFVDYCLIEMNKGNEQMTENQALITIGDLFLGGNLTTHASIEWLIIFLAAHQDVQNKLKEEIDRILPDGVELSPENINDLHYAKAIVYETQRVTPIFPSLLLGRKASEDVEIDGYYIPKNTTVIPCAEGCHFDPRLWKNPHQYNPGRFIDDQGHFKYPKQGYLPFGVGKRSCVGESIAKLTLPVFLVTLVKNFSIKPAGSEVNLKPALDSVSNRHADANQNFLFESRTI